MTSQTQDKKRNFSGGKLAALFGARDKILFQYFEEMGGNIAASAETFLELSKNLENPRVYADHLRELEHQNDEVKAKIHIILTETSFLQFDHDDIEKLAGSADDIIDLLWGAADRIANRFMLTDADAELTEISKILLTMCKDVKYLLCSLKNFKLVKNIFEITTTFHNKENKTDDLRAAVSARRYRAAKEKPENTHLFFVWNEVFQHLEHAADKCVDITDVLNKFPRKYS